MPKISVIIPVYNAEKYIERCIRSLFEQTLDDIEYLFIDDCTQDRSIEIVKQILEEYPKRKLQVIIHRMEQNSGQAKVREWGMKNATGMYVIHCDSDDWVEHNMLDELYNCAVSLRADIVFCDYFLEYVGGDSVHYHRNVPCDDNISLIGKMLSGYYDANPLWGALVNRNMFVGLEYPTGNQGEDGVIMMQLIYNSLSMLYLEKPMYHYFVNDSSITHSQNISKVVQRVNDGIANSRVVAVFLARTNLERRFAEQFISYKFNIRLFLWNYMKDSKCRNLWNKVFPEINAKIFGNKFIPYRYKLYELIYRMGLSRFVQLFKY